MPSLHTLVTLTVLFIGNSLTYTNDLPRTVADLAAAGGVRIETAMVAHPNLALIDHYNGSSDAVTQIRSKHWDFVVLQQGPTSVLADHDSMVIATRLLDAEIRKAGARTALYMVWPSHDRIAYFDNVKRAYETSAAAVDGIFIPAGEAWRTAWAADASLPLYGGDDFHPSPLGTWLAALVIVQCIANVDVAGLPARVNGSALPHSPAVIAAVRNAASRTVCPRAAREVK